ncbi:hypothetical protein KIN20_021375 [Parelaphostrongylus tenuis]|uniref:Uncharacterized protein n=1 Tax=Parelaphostrongylus tenuis TaxID=148309 RepID=A0AAD5QUJ2_PARTN|nr:hypothetical protein KIN20_021375 [Parelaphostrongylus tenuis]
MKRGSEKSMQRVFRSSQIGEGIRKCDLWQRSETKCVVLRPEMSANLRKMIIPTNMAGLSSAPLMILLLVSISTVFGCGVLPGGQTSTRTFTASGPSNLPIIAVYTDNKVVSTLFPGVANSKDAVQALVQRFAMQTVVDVLEIEGRRALLPDFVISNILGQLRVNTTYEPLQCQLFREPGGDPMDRIDSCIHVGSTVTGICPGKPQGAMKCAMLAKAIDGKHLSLSGTLTTTNIIMANWSRSMWQNVVDRALRMLDRVHLVRICTR